MWACDSNYLIMIMRFKNTKIPSTWFTRYAMHLKHTADPARVWLSVEVVQFWSFLQLPTGSVPWEVFWEENISLVFLLSKHTSIKWSFLKKENVFWILLLRNYYFMTFVLPCIAHSEEDLWRFQVEAQGAYTCKQILGLCQ